MKVLKSISAIVLLIALIVLIDLIPTDSVTSSETINAADEIVFPHDEVVDVNIIIDEDSYNDMIQNAESDTYVMADITYNGYTYSNIAIKPKGNSSLKDVAKADGDRFSFKIDFNYYIDGQDFLGITKLNLNNLYMDATMMAEYLGYEMLESIDATASQTTFVALSINDEYYGLYLSVEEVNDSYLEGNFDNSDGELYKPEIGLGSTLNYISDDGMDYTGLVPENYDNYDNAEIALLISAINTGEGLDDIFNVDSFLKYLAMSTMTIHFDSYQGGMFHNYYLYNNDGVFEWITWDLNMIFNTFPKANLSDAQAIALAIDEAVIGNMSSYPLVEAIFNNESYVEQYHMYLEKLSNGYLESDAFNEKVLSVYNMIKEYVKDDSSAFYTYDEFESALFEDTNNSISLLNFINERVDNVKGQLNGDIVITTSTNVEEKSGESNIQRPDKALKNNTDNTAEGQTNQNNQAGQLPTLTDDNLPAIPPEGINGNMQAIPPEGVNIEGRTGGQMDGINNNMIEVSKNVDSSELGSNVIMISVLLLLMIGSITFLNKKR